jgi:DNA-directed RNA polymerase specialized sigma24 family protein
MADTPAPAPCGIDLARYHRDVRRLTLARYRRDLRRDVHRLLDPEDLVQEVCRRILRRNLQACAWDPSRGSLGHYVHQIASCAIADMLKPAKRRARAEVHSDPERWDDVPAPEPEPVEAPLDLAEAPSDPEEREAFFAALCCLHVLGELPAPEPLWKRALRERHREQTEPGQLLLDGRTDLSPPPLPSAAPQPVRAASRRGPRPAAPDPRQGSLF